MRFMVIHGPTLDLLGRREPDIYGHLTLEEIDARLREAVSAEGDELTGAHQSALEGEIISYLVDAAGSVDGALINPAAFSHTSRAIADAIRAVPYPVVEVHLTNIHAREPWRRRSVTAEACVGIVAGFGHISYLAGYRALRAWVETQ